MKTTMKQLRALIREELTSLRGQRFPAHSGNQTLDRAQANMWPKDDLNTAKSLLGKPGDCEDCGAPGEYIVDPRALERNEYASGEDFLPGGSPDVQEPEDVVCLCHDCEDKRY
jgi:hypothetical protein